MNYTKIEGYGSTIELCPICNSQAHPWRYSEDKNSPSEVAVMCSHDGQIGQRGGIAVDGCLLVMPPPDFYRARIADAINYWNDYAQALTGLRVPN
jgi:hypothetical protein